MSAGADKRMVLWDLQRRVSLSVYETPAIVSAMSWRPSLDANTLAFITDAGHIDTWPDIIPRRLPKPNEEAGALNLTAAALGVDGSAPDLEHCRHAFLAAIHTTVHGSV